MKKIILCFVFIYLTVVNVFAMKPIDNSTTNNAKELIYNDLSEDHCGTCGKRESDNKKIDTEESNIKDDVTNKQKEDSSYSK